MMVGSFVGFWMVLPLIPAGTIATVLAPAGLVALLALLAGVLVQPIRLFALGLSAGVVIGALLAGFVSGGLLAISTG